MHFRTVLALGGLGLSTLAAGCEGVHLNTFGSSISWMDNPVQFPVREEIHIVSSTHDTISMGSGSITFMEPGVCSVVSGPTCSGKGCVATIRVTNWGICMAKITAIIASNDEPISTCWYRAMFLGQDEMDAQEAAVNAALARCEDQLY